MPLEMVGLDMTSKTGFLSSAQNGWSVSHQFSIRYLLIIDHCEWMNDRSMTTQIRILQKVTKVPKLHFVLWKRRFIIALKGRNSYNQSSCPRVKFPRLSWSPGKAASTTCRIIFKSGQATFSSTQTRWPWQVQHFVSTSGMDNKAFELSELIKDPKGQVSLFSIHR